MKHNKELEDQAMQKHLNRVRKGHQEHNRKKEITTLRSFSEQSFVSNQSVPSQTNKRKVGAVAIPPSSSQYHSNNNSPIK